MARRAGALPERTLLNVSTQYLYFAGEKPIPLSAHHAPYCWAFAPGGGDAAKLREKLVAAIAAHKGQATNGGNDEATTVAGAWDDDEAFKGPPARRLERGSEPHPLAKIADVGPMERRHSFPRGGAGFDAFRVYAKRSWYTPEISDELFLNQGLYTGEHDIPYQQRATVDLAAEGRAWAYDTRGRDETLRLLVYDIETTQYGNEGAPVKERLPIDVIGYASFDTRFRSSVDLANEEFDLTITDSPTDWAGPEVVQLVARNEDEEIDNLHAFLAALRHYDVISGHNILSFDNRQIVERVEHLVAKGERAATLEPSKARDLKDFLAYWSSKDVSYNFGRPDPIARFYPTSLDTLPAARRFYFYLDDFTLKGLAPFLGVNVEDRVYLAPQNIQLDEKGLLYNKHDIQEQLGVTMNIINQALPLAFTTGSPFELLFSGLNTKMWDHMALIRAAHHKRLMPATCRAQGVATTLVKHVGPEPSRKDIVHFARSMPEETRRSQHGREFMRVAKYGDEMPDWVEYPHLIIDPDAKNAEDRNPYAIPGGMTLHPQDLGSHFVPWWHVVAADVGAMYPTILKALNVGADTVRIARADEQPDEWVWLYKVSDRLARSRKWAIRPVGETDHYADHGFMVGIKKSSEAGTVNLAMSAIMKMITKVKRDLGEKKKLAAHTDPSELKRLQLNYQSLKAARNAGTHGILVAVNVSCRQFNVLAGAHITSVGQAILHDALRNFREQGIRVVYGDTDGIYLACSRDGANLEKVRAAIGGAPDESKWITKPQDALAAVEWANERWRKQLNYPDFELEPEVHDAMVFVVHKNYLIFDWHDGRMHMETKGNNFKGADKANLARVALKDIMERVLKENLAWDDEEVARNAVKESIARHTKSILDELRLEAVNRDDLVLLQTVQPVSAYKKNPDGSLSTFARRAEALGKLLGDEINVPRKFRFVVTNRPLPGLGPHQKKSTKAEFKTPFKFAEEASGTFEIPPVVKKKPGMKPLDFMFPLELLEQYPEYKIDLDWYREMVEAYIRGAFSLNEKLRKADEGRAEKKDLADWIG